MRRDRQVLSDRIEAGRGVDDPEIDGCLRLPDGSRHDRKGPADIVERSKPGIPQMCRKTGENLHFRAGKDGIALHDPECTALMPARLLMHLHLHAVVHRRIVMNGGRAVRLDPNIVLVPHGIVSVRLCHVDDLDIAEIHVDDSRPPHPLGVPVRGEERISRPSRLALARMRERERERGAVGNGRDRPRAIEIRSGLVLDGDGIVHGQAMRSGRGDRRDIRAGNGGRGNRRVRAGPVVTGADDEGRAVRRLKMRLAIG